MGSEMPTAVWLEGQVDEDGVALTLLSGGPAATRVEEATYYTFDELQAMSGDIFDMDITGETKQSLVDGLRDANRAQAYLPESFDEYGGSDGADDSGESDESADAPGATPTEEKEPLSSDVAWDEPTIEGGMVYIDRETDEKVRVMNVHRNDTADSTRAIADLGEPAGIMVANEQANTGYPDDDPVVLVRNSGYDYYYYYVPVSRLKQADESDTSDES